MMIMSSKYSDESRIIRCYSVTDPTLHPRGHTIYKVVEKKLDVEAFDEAVQESVSWKRYNEFYRLYMSLSSLHASLHRKEEFPDFPKPQMFRRFDAGVIKDRMQSAQDLLNFIGQRKYLIESRAFKDFFQDLELLNPTVDASILQPSRVGSADETACKSVISSNVDGRQSEITDDYTEDDEDFEDESSYTEDDDFDDYDDGDSEIFGPSYDTYSAQVAQSDETQSLDSLIDEHCMSQSLHLDLFRNHAPPQHWDTSEGHFQNKPFTCGDGDDNDDNLQEDALKPQENLAEVESEEDLTFDFSKKDDGSVKRSFLRKSFFPVQAIWKTGKNLKHLLSASFHGSLPSPSKEESKLVAKRKMMQILSTRTYIVEAAHCIKEAKLKENSGQFGDAFDLYKSAIGTMLNGVQSDTNTECVEFVRSKISRYLTKAEELYKVHLQCHEPYLFKPSNTNRYCRDISLLGGSSDDLGKFKVIGVMNKVMLVVDGSSAKSDTYVMKVYPKTSLPTRNQTNIVPTCIPFMLGLIRFYETETAIYALLPHIATGTLWNHVAGYMQHSLMSDSTPDVFEDAQNQVPNEPILNKEPTSKSSEYSNVEPSQNINSSLVQHEEKSSVDQSKETAQAAYIESSDMTFEANTNFLDIRSSESFCKEKTPEPNHSGSSSDGILNTSDCDFHEILQKNTNQCISMFSINSSEGDATPVVLHSNQIPDQILFSSEFETPLAIGNKIPEVNPLRESLMDREFYGNNQINLNCVSNNTLTPDLKLKENDPKSVVKRLTIGLSSSCSEISKKNVYESSRVRTSSSTFEELDLSGCCRVQASNIEEIKRRNVVLLPEKFVKLWAAEIVLAISCLHECGIICRDLNPDNILIDARGHIILTYFCQWTTVEQRINSSALDNFYCAPELSSVLKITRACDWWSFGVIIFELLTGMSLKYYRPCGITQHTTDVFPPHLSLEAQSLLKKLIVYNPCERIGPEEIKSHPFFHGINWSALC